MRKSMKKYVCLLSAVLMLVAILSLVNVSASTEQKVYNFTDEFLAAASEHQFEGVSIDGLRQILDDGRQIYRNLRVQSDYTGTMTYRVPVPTEEIEHLIGLYDGSIQPFSSNNPFPYTRIRYSGLPHEDSIVIILLSDGFAESQFGTVLYHANNSINAMLNTHPFGLFEDLFTVYVIHTFGNHSATGFGYLGTISSDGSTIQGRTTRQPRIRELANSIVSVTHQDMIQVISNAGAGSGFAWPRWHYRSNATIAVTSIRNAVSPPGGSNVVWPNGTAWQGTFVHEFGHSFGGLVDEHGNHDAFYERSANTTQVPNQDVKWNHWFGHRNVLHVPTRFVYPGLNVSPAAHGWAVPAAVSTVAGQSGCMMRASSGNRNFCGVCTAELVRRLAHLSGEIFDGRGPGTADPLPNTPTVTMPQNATRILDSAFHGNVSLNTITIPASINTIGDFAFIGATGLRTINNQRTIPQQINNTTFAGLNRAIINVNIPTGTTAAFRAAGWAGFTLIEQTPLTATLSGHIVGHSTSGHNIAQQTVTVTLTGDTFANTLTGNWITNLPHGLVQSVARINDTTAAITVSGEAHMWSFMQIRATIPVGALVTNSNTVLVATRSENAVYNMACGYLVWRNAVYQQERDYYEYREWRLAIERANLQLWRHNIDEQIAQQQGLRAYLEWREHECAVGVCRYDHRYCNTAPGWNYYYFRVEYIAWREVYFYQALRDYIPHREWLLAVLDAQLQANRANIDQRTVHQQDWRDYLAYREWRCDIGVCTSPCLFCIAATRPIGLYPFEEYLAWLNVLLEQSRGYTEYFEGRFALPDIDLEALREYIEWLTSGPQMQGGHPAYLRWLCTIGVCEYDCEFC